MPHPAPSQQNMRPRRSRSLPVNENPDNGTSGLIAGEKEPPTANSRRNRRRSLDGQSDAYTLHRHNTRGRNGTATKTAKTEVKEKEQLSEETPDEDFDKEIEETAFRLSSLDQQAHAESQILDANRICRELLLPLALPWNYPEQVLDATTPLDLDDLPMLTGDELGHHELSRSTLESTDVVGVMHLRSYVAHPSHYSALNFLVPSESSSPKIDNFAGAMALRQYEASMSRKRKVEELESPASTPLYLIASFPWSQKVGNPQHGQNALGRAKSKNESYDRRPPASTLVDGILEEREWLPRSCFNWLNKGMKDDSNTKISRSKIRRTLKKPLVARVSLRINGMILSSNDASVNMTLKTLGNFTVNTLSKDDPAFKYTEEVLDDALESTCDHPEKTPPESSFNHMQCTLNADAMFQNATRDVSLTHRRSDSMNAVRRLRQPLCFSIQSDSQFLKKGESGSVHTIGFHPPHLDCFGTVDGLLRQCASKYNRCFICWGSCDGASVVRCTQCSISVHCSCARLVGDSKHKWVCSACNATNGKGSKSSSVSGKCARCPLPSGLLRSVGTFEMHHLCAKWGDESRDKTAKCCLCSHGSGSLLECAADGCYVKFHPSCAAVASAFGDIHNLGRDDDLHHCTQYTLSMAEINTIGCKKLESIPIAFCGYHNPKRSDMFLGLYPEGCYLDPNQGTTPALRIPPSREMHSVSNDEGNANILENNS